MKVEKAIEILQEDIKKTWHGEPDTLTEAEALGVEALKRLRVLRGMPNQNPNILLPGETEK